MDEDPYKYFKQYTNLMGGPRRETEMLNGKIGNIDVFNHTVSEHEILLLTERNEARQFAFKCYKKLEKMTKERNGLQVAFDEITNPSIEFLRNEFALTQKPGGILSLWIEGFRQMLEDSGAKNYLEISLRNALDADDPVEYIFTIQKRDGKTPHELRREAEDERDALQLQLTSAKQELSAFKSGVEEGATMMHAELKRVKDEHNALQVRLDEAVEALEYIRTDESILIADAPKVADDTLAKIRDAK